MSARETELLMYWQASRHLLRGLHGFYPVQRLNTAADAMLDLEAIETNSDWSALRRACNATLARVFGSKTDSVDGAQPA